MKSHVAIVFIMPHVTISNHHQIIIMDDGDQYFEKKIIVMSKKKFSAMCQILIDG
jgi:hypothetical protein